jgi:hypothetical protein
MDPMQLAGQDAMPDAALAKPDLPQLPEGDNAMLALGAQRDRRVHRGWHGFRSIYERFSCHPSMVAEGALQVGYKR